MKLKKIFSTSLKALILTMFLAAFFHMILLMILTVTHGDLKYMNPLTFLGITIFRPDLQNSHYWLWMGWALLILLFLIMVWVVLNGWLIAAYVYNTRPVRRWLAIIEKLPQVRDKASSTAKKLGVKIK